jgi:hypothetical protein
MQPRGAKPAASRAKFRFVLFFVFVLFLVLIFEIEFVSIFGGLVLVFVIFRDNIQAHRMDLSDFKLRIALQTSEDFALLDFVFVEINLGIAFGASHHVKFSFMAKSSTGKRII